MIAVAAPNFFDPMLTALLIALACALVISTVLPIVRTTGWWVRIFDFP